MKSCFAYIRVSTQKQGQRGTSLQEQRDEIVSFARLHNLTISQWFEDRETAAKKGRTQFMRMMAALEKRKAAGVIVHKIDRGARNYWDWAHIQDLLDAGIEVHFAHDNLDLKSRGGRLAADIQAAVAVDYIRNLRDEVKKGQRGRLKQGLTPFSAPIGYLNHGKGNAKTIDPIKGPLVRRMFELYATKHYSFRTLRAELHRQGFGRRDGAPLNLCTLTSILRNPFYAGVIRLASTGEVFSGIHEPLIDAELFRKVQDIMDGKLNAKPLRHDFLYRRLFKCDACSVTLIGERQKGIVYYRCQNSACITTGVREDAISQCLVRAVADLAFSDSDLNEMLPLIDLDKKEAEKATAEHIKTAQLRIDALTERDRRLTDAYLDQRIEQDAYRLRRDALLLELASAKQAHQRATTTPSQIALQIKGFLEFVRYLRIEEATSDTEKFRDAFVELTSNRLLIGKEPYLTTQSPFRELISDLSVLTCGHTRDAPRTSTLQRATARRSKTHYQHVVHLLKKHLKDWQPPVWAMPLPEPRRQPSPNWRQQLRNQPSDDLRDVA